MRTRIDVERLTHALWRAENNLRNGINDLEFIFTELNQAELSDGYFAANDFCLELQNFINNARAKIRRLASPVRF